MVQKNAPLGRVAQSTHMPGSAKVIAPPANPIMDRRQHPIPPRTPNINNDEQIVSSLSDENAEKVDREHLENVNSSANALGL